MDSKCNAHSLSQPLPFSPKSGNFDVNAGLLSTTWTYMFCHKWKEFTRFQADAQCKVLEGEHTPHYQI